MRIGVIGLGRMGSALARRIIDQGSLVVGFDISAERLAALAGAGFESATSPRDVAARADVVLTSVFNGSQLRSVLSAVDGVLAAGRSDVVLADLSTISVADSADCARMCAEHGVSFVRASISGNPGMALRGQLGIYCSGDAAGIEKTRPVFDLVAANCISVGAREEAKYVKLAVNMVVTGLNVLLSEAFALATAAGIQPQHFFESIRTSAVRSPFVTAKIDALEARDFAPTMTAKDVRKDLGYALGAGKELDLAMPVSATVDQVYAAAAEMGLGDLDFGATALVHTAIRESWYQPDSE